MKIVLSIKLVEANGLCTLFDHVDVSADELPMDIQICSADVE